MKAESGCVIQIVSLEEIEIHYQHKPHIRPQGISPRVLLLLAVRSQQRVSYPPSIAENERQGSSSFFQMQTKFF
jgi:hypothetical protein